MNFFCNKTYAFGVIKEGHAQSLAFTLPQLHANVIKYFLVLGAQDHSYNVFFGHSLTTLLYNTSYFMYDITLMGREHAKPVFKSAPTNTTNLLLS